MYETMPNRAGLDSPVFTLAHLVEIIDTAAANGFTLTDNDHSALDHARNPYTDNGVADAHEIHSRYVDLPFYIRALAARALLHRL
ncbi:hypothetical protein [Streptomyces noursei]|uniref:hypothetical protein n=1 Tax=Streptomyces noursei TaxID=1971 RepID=UPI003819AF91